MMKQTAIYLGVGPDSIQAELKQDLTLYQLELSQFKIDKLKSNSTRIQIYSKNVWPCIIKS